MHKPEAKNPGAKPKLMVVCEVASNITWLDLDWIEKHRYLPSTSVQWGVWKFFDR
jgi:hypothetical protein